MSYSAVLDVPWNLFYFVVNRLTVERRRLGTRKGTRALSDYMQAKMVLCRLRDRPDLASLGCGFGVSLVTTQRYCHEGIDVLSDYAPDLEDLIKRSVVEGWDRIVVDGSLVPGSPWAPKPPNIAKRSNWPRSAARSHRRPPAAASPIGHRA